MRLPPIVASTADVVREAGRIFAVRGGRMLAGAIAFYSLLSAVPLFVVALRVAAAVTDEAAARATLLAHVARWVGPGGAATVGDWLARAAESGSGAGLLGSLVLVYGSTRLFANLIRAFDTLWGIDPPVVSTMGERAALFLRRRLLAFALVVAVGVVIVGLVLAHGALAAAREALPVGLEPLDRAGELAVSFGTTTVLFGALFWALPSARVRLRDALRGGLLTAALFTLGAFAVGAWVAHKASESPFGGATGLVLIMLWVHYAAHVFFFGVALTHVLARR